ncbi:DUF3990 domain-containing protein [Oceanobacillus longus]|uniref:DUF3990 domain-containing protein n=1 Tax=Oceanobacillus longus TaxID=930120 RepID=A0ABV8H0B3_9BACI
MLPNTSKLTVYHGTNLFSAKVIKYNGIMLNAQRDLTDFGKGFYVTPHRKQAIEWALVKAQDPQVNSTLLKLLHINKDDYLNHPETRIPAFLSYHLNVKQLFSLHGLLFPMPYDSNWFLYKARWKDFVESCRLGMKHPFDFVYGPIGGRHNGTYAIVRPSKLKEQLALNSDKAMQCLSNLRITRLRPVNTNHEKKLNEHFLQRNRNKSVMNHPFLRSVCEELFSISQRSYLDADECAKFSWMAHQISKQESILWNESPTYWAFFILYGNKKLWYNDYESYLVRQQRNKK